MSTIRAFSNNKRISTGRAMKNGSFFQAYPTHQVFASQDEWETHWKKDSSVRFVEEGYEDMPPLIPTSTIAPKVASAPPPPASSPIRSDDLGHLAEMLRNGVTGIVNEWYRKVEENSTPKTPPTAATPTNPPPLTRKTSTKQKKNEEWNYKKVNYYVAPPGTYYIGDICYFLKSDLYDNIFGGEGYESGLYTTKENAFFMVDHTAYGDGEYRGSDGFAYGVDAGIIGIVSRSLGCEKDEQVYGGKLHTFKEPVEIKFSGGVFRFQSHSKYLIIDTAGNTYNSDEDW